MKKLFELVTIVSNTEDAVVLRVKPNCRMDLICLGCFNGDEDILRLTKGRSMTCTVWTTAGNHYDWSWGEGGYTLVSENMTKKGHMIKECIEDGFDILVYGSRESIRKNMNAKNHDHEIVLWENAHPLSSKSCGCRKDDEFYRYFDSIATAIQHFKDLGYTVTFKESKKNACNGLSHYYTLSK